MPKPTTTKKPTKRPRGRPITGRGTTGARVTLRMSLADHEALQARAALANTTGPMLVYEAARRGGLFSPPKD